MDPKANAAAALGGQPDDSSGAPEQREDTFFLPADFPGADALEEGATITLKVVSKGDNGIEVEQVGDEPADAGGDDMGAALDKHMAGSKTY